ncbi:hypothetical protein B0H34DRAFT_464126 [Crassisporium funariophilum]|nr:hypothetical protein B0H34DRAFT_464126 [Crassisporium funariophilum]
MSLTSLPSELILEILFHTCQSQEVYRLLLLINWRFHGLVKFATLLHVPIRIGARNVRSFSEQLTESPELAKHVNYLWINGISADYIRIARACINLISLACSKPVLYSLCSPPPQVCFLHRRLTELTLFDSWECWKGLSELPGAHGRDLCRQMKRLRVHESLSSDFNAELFPSLSHFSISTGSSYIQLRRDLMALAPLPKLEHIVITTFHWIQGQGHETTKKVIAWDKRLRILYFGSGEQGEFELWCGRARKGDCIWSKRMDLRQLC